MAATSIFQELSELLRENRKEISEFWLRQLNEAAGTIIVAMGRENAEKRADALLNALINALPSGVDIQDKGYAPIVELLQAASVELTVKNCTPSETATYVFSLKDALLNALQTKYPDKLKLNDVANLVNKLVDQMGLLTFATYVKAKEDLIAQQQKSLAEARERLIQEQKRTIMETAAPVVQIWDKVLMIPLIGILDSERTQLVMDRMLSRIEATQSKVVILDITGIPTVDTLVARHLVSTTSAARLMGAECIVTGISARIAQTVVQMGVEMKGINTRSTMADGLRDAFDRLGLKLAPR